MIRSFVKRRAVSIRALCSSESEKSTTGSLLHALARPLELALRRARADDVAGEQADRQHERDVDDVPLRHHPEVGHQSPPLFFARASAACRSESEPRARATEPSS